MTTHPTSFEEYDEATDTWMGYSPIEASIEAECDKIDLIVGLARIAREPSEWSPDDADDSWGALGGEAFHYA